MVDKFVSGVSSEVASSLKDSMNQDIATTSVEKFIEKIEKTKSSGKMPELSISDVPKAYNIAKEFGLTDLLKEIERTIKEIAENLEKEEDERRKAALYLIVSAYYELKEFDDKFKKNPLKTLLSYLEDEESKETTRNLSEFLDNNLLISDERTFDKFKEIVRHVGSPVDRHKRNCFINSEELYDQVSKLKQKENNSPEQVTIEEKGTNEKIRDKLSKLIDREIFDKVATKHQNIHGKEVKDFSYAQAKKVNEETREVKNILKTCAREEHHIIALLAKKANVIENLITEEDKSKIDRQQLQVHIDEAVQIHEANIIERNQEKTIDKKNTMKATVRSLLTKK